MSIASPRSSLSLSLTCSAQSGTLLLLLSHAISTNPRQQAPGYSTSLLSSSLHHRSPKSKEESKIMAGHLRLLLLLVPALLLAGAPHATAAGDLLGPALGATTGVGSKALEPTGVGSKEAEPTGVGSKAPEPTGVGSKAPEPTGVGSAEPTCIGAAERQANRLATQLALICWHGDLSGASCCELVVAFVDDSGGAGCLSRVSRQSQLFLAGLDTSHILALYASCGRARLPADSKLGEYSSATVMPSPPVKQIISKQAECDAAKLAVLLVRKCTVYRSRSCCQVVLMTVDGSEGCLCSVASDPTFVSSSLSVAFIWDSYKACEGRRHAVPKDRDACSTAPAPPPASPPPPPASPPPPPASPSPPSPTSRPSARGEGHRVLSKAEWAGIGSAVGVVAIAIAAAVGVVVFKLKKSAAPTSTPFATDTKTSSVVDQLPVPTATRQLVPTATTQLVPTATTPPVPQATVPPLILATRPTAPPLTVPIARELGLA